MVASASKMALKCDSKDKQTSLISRIALFYAVMLYFALSDGTSNNHRLSSTRAVSAFQSHSYPSRARTSSYLGPSFFVKESSAAFSESERGPCLVVLIPAFNEVQRIQQTLHSYHEYLLNCTTSDFSMISQTRIVVIDDGSTDETADIVNNFPATKQVPIHCISLASNQGKGAALSYGVEYISKTMFSSSNNDEEYFGFSKQNTLILIVDADGSADLVYLEQFLKTLTDHALQYKRSDQNLSDPQIEPTDLSESALVVVGSRAYDIMSRRGITRWGFQTTVAFILGGMLSVRDTQCGYKLLALPVAELLYKDLHLTRWSNDVEVLYRAKLHGIPCKTVPVEWEDKDGSKVEEIGVVKVSLQMLVDVMRLRWQYRVTKKWK